MPLAEPAARPESLPTAAVTAGADGGFRLNLRFDATGMEAFLVERASIARALSTFDTFDQVGPMFRLTDHLRVDVTARADSPGPLVLESIWLRSAQATMHWGVTARNAAGERLDSQPLEIHSFTAFRPALKLRCGVLLGTVHRDAAVGAIAAVLREALEVLDFHLDAAKVGFVDEYPQADGSTATEACHVGFSVVLRLDAVDQANRQFAEAMLGELLDEAFGEGGRPPLISRDPARHCELTVSHPVDGEAAAIA